MSKIDKLIDFIMDNSKKLEISWNQEGTYHYYPHFEYKRYFPKSGFKEYLISLVVGFELSCIFIGEDIVVVTNPITPYKFTHISLWKAPYECGHYKYKSDNYVKIDRESFSKHIISGIEKKYTKRIEIVTRCENKLLTDDEVESPKNDVGNMIDEFFNG